MVAAIIVKLCLEISDNWDPPERHLWFLLVMEAQVLMTLL
jgi:hypothetical protein